MSATSATVDVPVRSAVVRSGRVTQARVFRSEWTKLWSLRSTRWTLLVAILGMAGLGPLIATVQMNRWAHIGPGDRLHFDPINTALGGYHFAQLAIGVLGVLVLTGEYSTGGAAYALRDDPDQAEHALETASRTGRLALAEMRRLLGVLRQDSDGAASDRDPQPGVPEIDRLIEQVRAAGLPVSYRVSPNARALPAGIQLTLFRIVQEALTNSLKHAGLSAAAEVELAANERDVRLSVADYGGSTAPPNGNGGSGLRGMRERAAVYSGVVEAGPGPDGGWRVAARLPLPEFDKPFEPA